MTGWGLDTLFNPSKRHMDEEKQRLQATREEVGDNSGGERIDVSTGKVVIRRKGDEPAAGDTPDGAGPDAKATKADEPKADDSDTPAGRARRRRAALRKANSTH